jgi:hypothetical protein
MLRPRLIATVDVIELLFALLSWNLMPLSSNHKSDILAKATPVYAQFQI